MGEIEGKKLNSYQDQKYPVLTLFCVFMSAETEMSAESWSNGPEVVKLSGKGGTCVFRSIDCEPLC